MAGTIVVDRIESDGSYASTINVASKVNFTGGMQIGGQDTTFAGMRNRIINGAMVIDQRNAGASVTGNNMPVDRWSVPVSQSAKLTAQQNAGSVTPPAGFTNYVGITSSSAYSVLTADWFLLGQKIEGYNVADLGWGAAGAATITLSFWVRSSLTGTFGGVVQNNAQTRSYPFTYTINQANTWEYKTITIPGDTTGTWEKTNSTGISLYFGLGVGSSLSGTAGAWAGTNYNSATGATSVVGTNGATFYITGVQVEKSSVATAFENRLFGQEFALCQRYYETSFQYGVAPFQGASPGSHIFAGYTGVSYSSSAMRLNTIYFSVTKRAAPSITLYRPGSSWGGTTDGRWSGYVGGWVGASATSVTDSYPATTGFGVDMTLSGATTAGAYICMGGWSASSEL